MKNTYVTRTRSSLSQIKDGNPFPRSAVTYVHMDIRESTCCIEPVAIGFRSAFRIVFTVSKVEERPLV